MPLAVVGVLLVVAFLICDWSGRTLAHHYQDRLEAVATFAVGGCVLGSLILTGGSRDSGNQWPVIALAVAMTAGLFAGYLRSGPLR